MRITERRLQYIVRDVSHTRKFCPDLTSKIVDIWLRQFPNDATKILTAIIRTIG